MKFGTLNISHSIIKGNTAHRNGGAVYASTHESYPEASSTLWLLNVTEDNNVADASGGGCPWQQMP
jgi:hypothetical protein